MKHLVLGFKGQIGNAVYKVLSDLYEVDGIDVDENNAEGEYDVIHVAIPGDLDDFEDQVEAYQVEYLADNGMTIIHSTVPVGTSKKLGAVHSPVRGVHPDLEEGVRTFVKFFGGEYAEEAAEIFEKLGVDTITTDKARDTEAMKIWSTTIYAFNVILEKAIKQYCDEKDVDFDIVYKKANETYNMGYEELDMNSFKKYILTHIPGKIGGHCLIPNLEFLDNWVADLIEEKNETLKDV